MSEPLWQPRSDLAARVLGAAFFFGGSGLLAFQGRSILNSLARGGTVTYFSAAIALGEMGVVMGAYWLVRGLAGYQATRRLNASPRALKILMLVSAVVIGGTLTALHLWLQSQGYDS